VKQIAENIAKGLIKIAPDKEKVVLERLKKFQDRIDDAMFGPELIKEMKGSRTLLRKLGDGTLFQWLEDRKLADKAGGWIKLTQPLRGVKMIEYHKTWIYAAKNFGFQIVGGIQSKPGIEPGPKHLAELKRMIADEKVKAIIVDNFYPTSVPNALAQDTGVKVAVVPGQPGGEAGTDDYVDFMTHVLQKLVEAVK
jgi:ABC-type Zn uptake system ZnuABC Zn-binding protein ZnuA